MDYENTEKQGKRGEYVCEIKGKKQFLLFSLHFLNIPFKP